MKTINKETLEQFLEIATEKLPGKWLVFGGTVLPLLGARFRATLDIDLASLDGDASISDLMKMMEIAESLGLPPETINQAGSYFIQKLGVTEEHCTLLHKGSAGSVYRPNATTYLLLKIPRMSESDLEDCLAWIRFCESVGERVDAEAVRDAIQKEIRAIRQGEMGGRRDRLRVLEAKFV